mmetsp:Transcript_25845/g.81754  ORF Transcript_25845/g.81754 Transcript_25845/m.81754 type:complete len:265 (+) Transcript_25845:282-1076(+)
MHNEALWASPTSVKLGDAPCTTVRPCRLAACCPSCPYQSHLPRGPRLAGSFRCGGRPGAQDPGDIASKAGSCLASTTGPCASSSTCSLRMAARTPRAAASSTSRRTSSCSAAAARPSRSRPTGGRAPTSRRWWWSTPTRRTTRASRTRRAGIRGVRWPGPRRPCSRCRATCARWMCRWRSSDGWWVRATTGLRVWFVLPCPTRSTSTCSSANVVTAACLRPRGTAVPRHAQSTGGPCPSWRRVPRSLTGAFQVAHLMPPPGPTC